MTGTAGFSSEFASENGINPAALYSHSASEVPTATGPLPPAIEQPPRQNFEIKYLHQARQSLPPRPRSIIEVISTGNETSSSGVRDWRKSLARSTLRGQHHHHAHRTIDFVACLLSPDEHHHCGRYFPTGWLYRFISGLPEPLMKTPGNDCCFNLQHIGSTLGVDSGDGYELRAFISNIVEMLGSLAKGRNRA